MGIIKSAQSIFFGQLISNLLNVNNVIKESSPATKGEMGIAGQASAAKGAYIASRLLKTEEDAMRDLLYKNITSPDRHRKVLASTEIFDSQGMRSTIHRHFICLIKHVGSESVAVDKPKTHLTVLKEHNSKFQHERFVCRVKGGLYTVSEGQTYLILFMHSLNIHIMAIPQKSMKYC